MIQVALDFFVVKKGITCWSWLQVNTVAPCLKQHRTDRSPSVTQSYLWRRVCSKMPAFMSLKEWKCFDRRKTWHGTDLIKKLPKNLGLLRHVFYFWQMKYGTEWQLLFLTQTSSSGGGGGHSIMFYMEGSASMSNLLPFYIYHFWQKRRIPSNDE